MAKLGREQVSYRLIRVEWMDSCSSHGWVDKDDLSENEENLSVYSVGYLIKEKSGSITVSSHIASQAVDAPMTIPKCAIKLMTDIVDNSENAND